MVPLYVRVVDGRAFHQAVRTRTLVNPSMWDEKGECIKSRVLCSPEERMRIDDDVNSLRTYIFETYNEAKKKGTNEKSNWLATTVDKFYASLGKPKKEKKSLIISFDELYDQFLEPRKLAEGRRRHYEVLRRMIHRYETYVKCSQSRTRYHFDITKVDKDTLKHLYDYIENEHEYVTQYPKILEENPEAREIHERGENYMSGIFKRLRAFFNWTYNTKLIENQPFTEFEMPSEKYGSPIYLTLSDLQQIYSADFSSRPSLAVQRDIFIFQCNVGCRVGDLIRLKKHDVINGAIEYIPSKTINENVRTVVVPLNAVAQEIISRYEGHPGDRLLPFESPERYNDNIKIILELAGVTYMVTVLDSITRKEKKVPINEIASSHMARRTFIGNIYKLVKDPNLVSSLTGHVEGSRAFNRYRTIDVEMKKDLVKMLEMK